MLAGGGSMHVRGCAADRLRQGLRSQRQSPPDHFHRRIPRDHSVSEGYGHTTCLRKLGMDAEAQRARFTESLLLELY